MAVAAAAAVLLNVYDYLAVGTGIDHTEGAILVILSSALVALAALVLALGTSIHRGLRVTLQVLLLLGILGTGLAAWFLESQWLIGLMVVALIGWVLCLRWPERSIDPPMRQQPRKA